MQKKNISFIIAAAVILLAGAYFIAHQSQSAHVPAQSTNQSSNIQTAGTNGTIRLVAGSIDFLTDNNGMTLYHYLKDMSVPYQKPPYSECIGNCALTWQPFYVDTIVVSAPLKSANFKVFTRSDGKKQVAFRGWPLYYYTGDYTVGDTNGQGIDKVWYMGVAPN